MPPLLILFFDGVDFEIGHAGRNQLLPEIDFWRNVGYRLLAFGHEPRGRISRVQVF